MKKTIITLLCVLSFNLIKAQATQYNGSWTLCKIVTSAGDTQLVSEKDTRHLTYNFTYNNTFTSFRKEQNEEVSGVWSFEFKTKTIKIRNALLIKTRTKLENYDIVINKVTSNFFVEIKTENEKKKLFSYYIYCRTK
jgi:hypothetical protein